MSAVEAVPNGADDEKPSAPFDLDAVIAEREERTPFEFTFGGELFVLPPSVDVRVVAALSGERFDDALRMLLGSEQWARLQAVEAVFDFAALEALFQVYGEHLGEDLTGEAAASTRSSRRTAKRSRPTSSGTTRSRSRT